MNAISNRNFIEYDMHYKWKKTISKMEQQNHKYLLEHNTLLQLYQSEEWSYHYIVFQLEEYHPGFDISAILIL